MSRSSRRIQPPQFSYRHHCLGRETRFRNSWEEPDMLKPGEVYEFRIDGSGGMAIPLRASSARAGHVKRFSSLGSEHEHGTC